MFKSFIQKRKARKGFSLIELLIVIAIIGIIATIAIPLLLSARNNAINEKARNSLRTVVSAQAAHYAATGAYGDAGDLTDGTDGGPYLDDRYAASPIDLGQGITVTITCTGQAAGAQTYTASATGATVTYNADETGEVQ